MGKTWLGVALIVAGTAGEAAQLYFHQGWFVAVWVVSFAAGLALLTVGLNERKQELGNRTLAAILSLGIFALIVFPFFFVVFLGSFLSRADLVKGTPYLFPPAPTLEFYLEFFSTERFAASVRNSLLVSSTATVFATTFGLLGAYALARLRFPARASLHTGIMVTYMLPGIALIVPLVATLRFLGLVDTGIGMFLGHSAIVLPLVVWFLCGAFDNFPDDLEQAARIDGCGRFALVRKVVLPLTLPSVATTAVFAFVISWNELLFSRVMYISNTPMLSPIIVLLIDPISRVEPKLSAAGVVSSIPVLVLAFALQRYIIREIAEGAIK